MPPKQSKIGLICDIAFELVLILVILLAALLVSRNDVVAPPEGYTVEPVSLIVTLGLVVFYLVFIVRRSLKEKSRNEEAGHD